MKFVKKGGGAMYLSTNSQRSLHRRIVVQKWGQKFFIAALRSTTQGFRRRQTRPGLPEGKNFYTHTPARTLRREGRGTGLARWWGHEVLKGPNTLTVVWKLST